MLLRTVADGLFLIGTQRLRSGKPRRALWYLAGAARLAPSNAEYFAAAAHAAYASGDTNRAVRDAEKALELDRELQSAHDLLGKIFVSGESYLDVLRRIHAYLRPRTYLEIGVDRGRSLRLALPGTQAIGIDPEPKLDAELPPNARVYRGTSDDFFARHDVRAEFGGLPVDLAFIDGMHHFEFALRDFVNIERWCDRDSTILIDDCLPRSRATAQRERLAEFWTGDVWKLVLLLRKYRPHLAIHTIAAPPNGVCVVRGLDPTSRVLADRLDAITAEFMTLDYSAIATTRSAQLNLFPNDWREIQPLLGAPRHRLT
jgi:hypothetical protein